MKVIDTGQSYNVADAAEGDGAGEVVVGVGPLVGIGPGVADAVVGIGPGERYKKYISNHPRRTRYRIG